MSWRGIEGGSGRGQGRPRRGHDPHQPLLPRLLPGEGGRAAAIGGFLPLRLVYAFEPLPPDVPADKAKHILGAGGNLWSEFFPNYAQVQYMAYPRGCAIAEAVGPIRSRRTGATSAAVSRRSWSGWRPRACITAPKPTDPGYESGMKQQM